MKSDQHSQHDFQIYADQLQSSEITPDAQARAEEHISQSECDLVEGDLTESDSGHTVEGIEEHVYSGGKESLNEVMKSNGRLSPLHSSGPSGDEAIFEEGSQGSSPSTSHHSSEEDESEDEDFDDEISEFPEEPFMNPASELLYTPTKQRSPFRHPSSVRAMQLDTTPPFNQTSMLSSSRSGRFRLETASSRNGTPRSVHSFRSLRMEKTKPPSKKKEYPLVLLHVTLLPIVFPHSLEIMTAVLPPQIMENYTLLCDKVNETMLERGVLLPHPKEDYELLEERLLESLELKLPRILKCGHFHLDEEDLAAIAAAEKEEEQEYHSEDEDADICEDCGRRVRDGKAGGAGVGHRRWNIKIFAANGLMRAGAWSAAWREMERIDVEIEPWIEEDLRKAMKVKAEEEEESARLHREMLEQAERRRTSEERLREIYGPMERRDEDTKRDIPDITQVPQAPPQVRFDQIPLTTLLQNYLYLLFQDPRNILLAAMAMLLVAILFNRGSASLPQIMTAVVEEVPAKALSSVSKASEVITSAVSEVIEEAATLISTAAAIATEGSVAELLSDEAETLREEL